MKKVLFLILAITGAITSYAQDAVPVADDTTRVLSLNEIIAMETQSKADYDTNTRLRNIWGHDTYLNISYNKTKLSSDEFPSSKGVFSSEYDNDLGVGLQWGHSYSFHKKPIGSVLFIGLDFTWMDINFNKYKAAAVDTVKYQSNGRIMSMPWHNEKITLGYAMSIGPSLTLYPFTPLHSKGADKIRLHFYFHVGYGAEGALIKNVRSDADISDQWAWAHGLHTAFGGSLTWDHIGLGYEIRNDGNLTYQNIDSEYDTGKMKAKEKTSRLYLQFRF